MRTSKAIRANIISWDSGGLSKDIDVIEDALQRIGCTVRFKGRRHRVPRSRLQSLLMTAGVFITQRWAVLTRRPPFDVNFFIESVFPDYLPLARVNTLFVNPEWFRDEIYDYLPNLDVLLCKTPNGVETVRRLEVPARNVGFSSPDKLVAGFIRSDDQIRCLHLAGQSALKGTESVIEAWSSHPEWPELTVVRRAKRYGGEDAPLLQELPNIRFLTDFVPDEQLRQLQNECEVHVIPSLAEGYGHVIGEAMSCAAVVVTTNAPPMNELVKADRGILVSVERMEAKDRSMLNYVDVADLEAQLGRVFKMSPEKRSRMGREARAWYEAQHVRFNMALKELLDELFQSNGGGERDKRKAKC